MVDFNTPESETEALRVALNNVFPSTAVFVVNINVKVIFSLYEMCTLGSVLSLKNHPQNNVKTLCECRVMVVIAMSR